MISTPDPHSKLINLSHEEGERRWLTATRDHASPLGRRSVEIGDRIRRGLTTPPTQVEVPASTVVRSGSGPFITPTFEVTAPFQVEGVREVGPYYITAQDPFKPEHTMLIPNHVLGHGQ